MTTAEHGWLPRTSCTEGCVQSGIGEPGHRVLAAVRSARRIALTLILLMGVPALAIPLPGHRHLKRIYCRTVLRSLGVRMTVSGGPIRNLPGQLVVSNHVSWVDVFAIGAVMPGSFVARADLITWPALGIAARLAGLPVTRPPKSSDNRPSKSWPERSASSAVTTGGSAGWAGSWAVKISGSRQRVRTMRFILRGR